MNPEEARQKLLEVFGQQLIINKDFDTWYALMKKAMQEELMQWCQDCQEGKAKGSVPSHRKHKDKFVFFRKIGGDTRCVLIKVQNEAFIELHLVKHKEYDDLRIGLGYKKSSYYDS